MRPKAIYTDDARTMHRCSTCYIQPAQRQTQRNQCFGSVIPYSICATSSAPLRYFSLLIIVLLVLTPWRCWITFSDCPWWRLPFCYDRGADIDSLPLGYLSFIVLPIPFATPSSSPLSIALIAATTTLPGLLLSITIVVGVTRPGYPTSTLLKRIHRGISFRREITLGLSCASRLRLY